MFNAALKITTKVKTYTNYGDAGAPLVQFVVPHTASSGSPVNSYQGSITIDGLYFAGSHGDGTMNGLGKGVCSPGQQHRPVEHPVGEQLSPPPSSPVPISATGGPAGNGASGGCSCRFVPAASRAGLWAGLIGLAVLTLRRASRRRSSRRRRTACASALLLS